LNDFPRRISRGGFVLTYFYSDKTVNVSPPEARLSFLAGAIFFVPWCFAMRASLRQTADTLFAAIVCNDFTKVNKYYKIKSIK